MYTGNFNSMGAYPFKFFEQMKLPEFDYEAVFSACRKNIEAVSEAQRKIMETVGMMSEMQTNFTRSAIEEASHFMKNFMNAKTLEEKAQLHSEAMKQGMERTMSHGRKIAEEWTKSHKDMTSHIGQSWNEHMKQAKETMKASSTKKG
jgi:phasin family protein